MTKGQNDCLHLQEISILETKMGKSIMGELQKCSEQSLAFSDADENKERKKVI